MMRGVDPRRSPRRWAGLAVLAGGLLTGTGCEERAAMTVEPAEPGPIPAGGQLRGDPERGYDILVNRGYMTCGVPYEAYRAAAGPSVEHALRGRRRRNARLPYYQTAARNADGVELVTTNCLLCHAGEIRGELVIGLGNAFADFTQSPVRQAEAFGLHVADGAAADAWRRWADRVGAIAPYMVTDTVGANPAPNLTAALMAHRDPETLAWHAEPVLEPPPTRPLPVKVPPWWRMQKKHAMFHHGGGRGNHVRFMMLKSLVCTDDVDEAERLAEWFRHIRAYIASLEPPAYPEKIDRGLAERGRSVFERRCARCHGTYGGEETYPNLLVSLEEVGTDPAYARQAVAAERFIRWFERSWYGRGAAEARPGLGYVAPPLDGVWATAPYLHNGSVPTLAALLDSDSRPERWLAKRPRRYDLDRLGWAHRVLPHGKAGAADADEAARIRDTTLRGHGNQGHTFGDALSDRQRRALLEYLKSL